MQIRKQLRNLSVALSAERPMVTCPEQGSHLGLGKVCRLGYSHSKDVRFRHKANKGPSQRGSGTAPRRTKKKGGGAGQ